MKKFQNHIVIKLVSNVIIVACVLCTLFGNGFHFHSLADHTVNHDDAHGHIFAHTHSDTTHSHSHDENVGFGFDENDAHQHPTATVNLTATLSQKITSRYSSSTNTVSVYGFIDSQITLKETVPVFLDLPPPHLPGKSCDQSSNSLRAPPLG